MILLPYILGKYGLLRQQRYFFGLLLGLAAWFCSGKRETKDLRWQDVALIGCAQVLALIPGTSRSGITLTAGLFAGFSRRAATRYAFMLAIPVIGMASVLELYKLFFAVGAPSFKFKS